MKKDKKKIIGEELSDERLKGMLNTPAEQGVDADYAVLMRAYRALRCDDFLRFMEFFKAAGKNADTKGPDGLTLKEEITRHPQSQGYLEAWG